MRNISRQIKPFEELFEDRTGGNKKIKQSDYLEKGVLPIIDQGQSFIAGYTNDVEAKTNVNLPCLIFGDHTKIFKYIDFPFALGADGVKILQPSEEIFLKYGFYFLNQVKLRGKEGYNRNYKYLKETNVPLPNLKTQQKISSILEQADTARQKRKQANQLTEQFLQSAFLKMFGDPVRNEKKWEEIKFSDVGTLQRGKSKHRPRNAAFLLGGKYPLIQTGEVANCSGYIREYTQTYSEEGLKQSKMWKQGTLAITIAANIAKTGILTFDACFPDSMVGFIPNEKTCVEYIQCWLSFLQKSLEDNAPESAQKNINLEILRKLNVPLPPLPLQKKFASLVERIEKLREKQRESERELENLFQSLMQKYFG